MQGEKPAVRIEGDVQGLNNSQAIVFGLLPAGNLALKQSNNVAIRRLKSGLEKI